MFLRGFGGETILPVELRIAAEGFAERLPSA
jgi:hypothetical protein